MPIHVAIIEDEKAISDYLCDLIGSNSDFSCGPVFDNAEDAIDKLPELGPDVVLTDIHLPGKSGIDCIRVLKAQCPATHFLICTSYEDPENVFNALKAGATGYITKTLEPQKLLDAIRDIYNGGSPMNSHIARMVVNYFGRQDSNPDLQRLSIREREILDTLSKGYRYKEIADMFCLSTETVRTHIRNIYAKLQVNSRTEALNKVYNRP